LGGHCNGGLIAFEIARRLEAEGDKVKMLVLICAEASNARYRHIEDWVTRFCSLTGRGSREAQSYFLNLRGRAIRLEQVTKYYTARLAEFGRASEREQIERVRRGFKLIKSLAISIARRKQRPDVRESSTAADCAATEEENSRQEIEAAYVKAMMSYVPRRYSGLVTLFWPAESPFVASSDSTWGWRDVAAEVKTHTVPGAHLTCITKHADEMAHFLRQSIDEACK